MSSRPTDPDLGFQRLVDDGFQVEVREQHLILHDVPYVASDLSISRASLICTYLSNAGNVLPPDNHQVWWTGSYPCFSNGSPIEQLRNEDQARELFPGCSILHRFSNKPDGFSNFADYHSKLCHYVALIQSQAQSIDSSVTAKGEQISSLNFSTQSPFAYPDSASTRASIQSTSSRLALKRVAIVGVGGTGSYVLDQVAKTPVKEIHIFDGDVFQEHNAFRSPGAASKEEIAQSYRKADYFKRKYESMHLGIVSHTYNVDAANISEIADFDFVFVCVDGGQSRRMLFDHLVAQSIPFVDVGMNLQLIAGTGKLLGTCRCTMCTPKQSAHFEKYVPLADDSEEAIYRQNIQIADMNAINAQLAVMKWKQYFGFYQDDFGAFNITFSVNSMSLARDVLVPPSVS